MSSTAVKFLVVAGVLILANVLRGMSEEKNQVYNNTAAGLQESNS
jgi:hypothetical protein